MRLGTATLALSLAALTIGVAQPASAQIEGPWCAVVPLGSGSVAERCDMRSFEQCRQEILGQGGTCRQNQWFRPSAIERPVRPSRHYR